MACANKRTDLTRRWSLFLRWWLLFMLICAGSVMLYMNGTVDKVNQVDFTKISFGIYTIFLGFSIHTGIKSYMACKDDKIYVTEDELHELGRSTEFSWFAADHLLTLGMIGTVLGFIFMLSTSFAGLSVINAVGLQEALTKMAIGMSTALYTTAVGLICSLLLKMQLFNYTMYLDKMAKLCECEVSENDAISIT